MIEKHDILEIIFEAVDEINALLPKSRMVMKSPDSILFGREGKLDSIGLVNLIVSVEGFIEDKFDKSITIADEKAMSEVNSPFRTIDSLADYIFKILNE